MDFINAALRVVHIVAAALWVGMSFTYTLFIIPAQRYAGAAGAALTVALNNRTAIARAFPAASITTVIAGILLYVTGSSNHFSSLGNAVLGLGAVAGLAAAGHGSGLGAVADRYAQASAAVIADASSDNVTRLSEINARLSRSAMVSLGLSAVALVLMASARYL